MASDPTPHFRCNSPQATADLAVALGRDLGPGDTLLLEGDIGAGKTHFARALIQSRLAVAEDVPSPTFTLVQVYDLPECELWHCDLYRLGDPDQVVELGLAEAFETAICIVEWPDRLADLSPSGALTLRFAPDPATPEARVITPLDPSGRWADRLARL